MSTSASTPTTAHNWPASPGARYPWGVSRTLLIVVLVAACAPLSARALDCAADDGLSQAAADLLLEGGTASADAVADAVRRAESDLRAVRAISVARDNERAVRAWLARQRGRSDAPMVCGEAADGRRRIVLAAFRGGILEPWPGSAGRVRVALAPEFTEPHLVIETAEGELLRLPITEASLERGVELPVDLPRPVTLQLVATGPNGPRPVARLRLGAAEPTPSGYSTSGGSDVPSRVADLREHHGVSPLRPNRILDAEARRHARHVCTAGRAVHRLDGEGDPEQRLRGRGIEARVVGETVARARTVSEAMSALADSPSHRMTLVDRRFTDGGYGTAEDRDGKRCVVVLLAAWPRVMGR